MQIILAKVITATNSYRENCSRYCVITSLRESVADGGKQLRLFEK